MESDKKKQKKEKREKHTRGEPETPNSSNSSRETSSFSGSEEEMNQAKTKKSRERKHNKKSSFKCSQEEQQSSGINVTSRHGKVSAFVEKGDFSTEESELLLFQSEKLRRCDAKEIAKEAMRNPSCKSVHFNNYDSIPSASPTSEIDEEILSIYCDKFKEILRKTYEKEGKIALLFRTDASPRPIENSYINLAITSEYGAKEEEDLLTLEEANIDVVAETDNDSYPRPRSPEPSPVRFRLPQSPGRYCRGRTRLFEIEPLSQKEEQVVLHSQKEEQVVLHSQKEEQVVLHSQKEEQVVLHRNMDEQKRDAGSDIFEQLHNPKQLISLRDIFKPQATQENQPVENQDEQVDKVLIVGRAGVGKSTLCRCLVHQWATGQIWQDDPKAKYVIWIPLRELISYIHAILNFI